MFYSCFIYDYKGPCYVYYLKTAEQNEHYKQAIDELNEKEIEAECCLAFVEQEKEKEEQWAREGKSPPARQASWEVYWKDHKQKRDKRLKGGVDNICYT
jgi:hypothetical protein